MHLIVAASLSFGMKADTRFPICKKCFWKALHFERFNLTSLF